MRTGSLLAQSFREIRQTRLSHFKVHAFDQKGKKRCKGGPRGAIAQETAPADESRRKTPQAKEGLGSMPNFKRAASQMPWQSFSNFPGSWARQSIFAFASYCMLAYYTVQCFRLWMPREVRLYHDFSKHTAIAVVDISVRRHLQLSLISKSKNCCLQQVLLTTSSSFFIHKRQPPCHIF